MPIEGFDYKAFANDLASQALQILQQQSNAAPDTLTADDKKWIIGTIKRFCLMAGEALANDPQIKLDAMQASLITQFIGEWTFHKSIDLINSQIPQENREPILQIIAANIFNTAKLAIIKNMPQEQLISLVETKVKQVYDAELEKLVKKGVLTPEQGDAAANQSNLNDMVQKTAETEQLEAAAAAASAGEGAQNEAQSGNKPIKFAALAVLLRRLGEEKAQHVLGVLNENDAKHVINYMKMADIEKKVSPEIMYKSLTEIKKLIPLSDKINVNKILKRFRRKVQSAPIALLEKIAARERENVKDFILDEAFPAAEVFSPHVLQAAAQIIEEKINDN